MASMRLAAVQSWSFGVFINEKNMTRSMRSGVM